MSIIKLMVNPIRQVQLESAFLFAACLWVYFWKGYDWQLFAWLFFVPDLSIFLYLKNPRLGGLAYNVMHFYGFPIALGVFAFGIGLGVLQMLALIWLSHQAFDRMLGWGLKYEDSFFNTHLGKKAIPLMSSSKPD